MEMQPNSPKPKQTLLWELNKKKYFIGSMAFVLTAYWLVQFAYQYYFISNGDANNSIIRSASLGGALLIAISLLIGPIQSLFPKYNFIDWRRTFSVGGFSMIIAHVISVTFFLYGGDFTSVYSDLNPASNPIAFGIFAFWFIFPLFLTSTDWAMRTLKFANWKLLHRSVYFTWMLAVMHFILVRPEMIRNIAGYLLLTASSLVFILEFFAFWKRTKRTHSSLAIIAGAAVILLFAALLYLAWPKFVKVLA